MTSGACRSERPEWGTTVWAQAQGDFRWGKYPTVIFVSFVDTETDRTFTRELLERLNAFPGRPWAELRNGKGITDLWLSQQLRRYGIRPRTLRIGALRAKGYLKDDFLDVCRRYVSKSDLDALVGESAADQPPPTGDNGDNAPQTP